VPYGPFFYASLPNTVCKSMKSKGVCPTTPHSNGLQTELELKKKSTYARNGTKRRTNPHGQVFKIYFVL